MENNLQNSELYETRYGWKESRGNFRFYLFLLCALLCLCVFRVWWTANFWGVVVKGTSMINTLEEEDKLLVRRVENADRLDYGTIIVVDVSGYEECADVDGGLLIKRLIAKEGDKVRCKDGQLEICYAGTEEFKALDEPYAHYKDRMEYDFPEYEVGEGEIFFLGDNRNESRDSRYDAYPSGSHLENSLYKSEDVVGYLPDWAYQYREFLEKILFYNDKE